MHCNNQIKLFKMTTKPSKWHKEDTEYTLELSDFDYLKGEFNITADSSGFRMESKIDDKLSMSINSYSIKYDRDVSARRMMIATERVDINVRVLDSVGTAPHEYQKYFPRTTLELINLIDEYKYAPMGEVKDVNVISFLEVSRKNHK